MGKIKITIIEGHRRQKMCDQCVSDNLSPAEAELLCKVFISGIFVLSQRPASVDASLGERERRSSGRRQFRCLLQESKGPKVGSEKVGKKTMRNSEWN